MTISKQRIKKLEKKINVGTKKVFCVFQDAGNDAIRYNDEKYENLEAFKIKNNVSDSDEILVVRFLR